VLFGGKPRPALERDCRQQLFRVYEHIFKMKIPTFRNCLRVADDALKDIKFDTGVLYYNYHKNSAQYERRHITLHSTQTYLDRIQEDMLKYELEGPLDIVENFVEFRWAVALWRFMAETDCAQNSARMSAMQGASKNSKEVLMLITREYNRARQTKITTELCEICGGVEALRQQELDRD